MHLWLSGNAARQLEYQGVTSLDLRGLEISALNCLCAVSPLRPLATRQLFRYEDVRITWRVSWPTNTQKINYSSRNTAKVWTKPRNTRLTQKPTNAQSLLRPTPSLPFSIGASTALYLLNLPQMPRNSHSLHSCQLFRGISSLLTTEKPWNKLIFFFRAQNRIILFVRIFQLKISLLRFALQHLLILQNAEEIDTHVCLTIDCDVFGELPSNMSLESNLEVFVVFLSSGSCDLESRVSAAVPDCNSWFTNKPWMNESFKGQCRPIDRSQKKKFVRWIGIEGENPYLSSLSLVPLQFHISPLSWTWRTLSPRCSTSIWFAPLGYHHHVALFNRYEYERICLFDWLLDVNYAASHLGREAQQSQTSDNHIHNFSAPCLVIINFDL